MNTQMVLKILYLLLVTALTLTLSGPTALPAQAGPSYTLIVDNAGDASGQACTAAPADCSLRSAIEQANAYPGAMDIDIFFAADYTIALGSNLPVITRDNLYIQGQDDSGMLHVVKINRNAADNCAEGGCQVMIINATNVNLYNLRLYGSGPGSANVWIRGSAQDVAIMNSVIGDDDPALGGCGDSPYSHSGIFIDATGMLNPNPRVMIGGSIIECNAGAPGYGIVIYNSDGVSIGEISPEPATYRNHIRLNGSDGIQIFGAGAHDNLILGNYIGVDPTGSVAAANGQCGIYAELASSTLITGNLISGNSLSGVQLNNTQAFTLANNYIGTNAAGTAALPNMDSGVTLNNDAANNHIGIPSGRNWISGNRGSGLYLYGGAHDNVVQNNYIGLNKTGTAAIPNGGDGVTIRDSGSDHNCIGTSLSGVSQLISGNALTGIYIQSAAETFIGQTTRVGVAGDGITALGNAKEGILLDSAGNTAVLADIIAYNGGAGVAVTGSASGNRIQPRLIRGNSGLPVDLGNDGPTPNDVGDVDSGPNGLLNYPVITGGSGSAVSGTTCKDCTVVIYQAIRNPAAAGGGGVYRQQTTADASGNWNATLGSGLTSANISMMACESPCGFTGSTSEMSPVTVYEVFLPLVLK